MQKPSVSVVIPIYKVENYIERCVCSLFEQTLEDIEYIFVNDRTPDRSMVILDQILCEYPHRHLQVKIIEHEQNLGLAAARNSGTGAACGEYIIHCDSDDWVEKDMYERMLAKAREKDADIVCCDYYADYSKRTIYCVQDCSDNQPFFLQKLLHGELHNGLWNKLIKKDLYNKLSFCWKEGVNMWEDVSIVLRLAFYARNIVFIHQAFYHYSQINMNAYTYCWKQASLENVMEVVNIVDHFFLTQNKDRYFHDLLLFKLRAKYQLLQNSSLKVRHKFRKIYPEADHLLFRHPGLPLHSKFMMWCWLHSLDFIAWLVLVAVNQIKKWCR